MNNPATPPERSPERLESWKEIAAYLGKGVRTVVRWEKKEGLPVHRHLHERRPTVFAYKTEIDAWWQSRRSSLEEPSASPPPVHRLRWLWLAGLIPIGAAALWLLRPPMRGPAPPLNFEPLTSYPGAQGTMTFSPDGHHFAFAWNARQGESTDLYVQAVGSAEPRRLTDHSLMDFSPAWSPDGKSIAFLRRSPQFEMELLVIPALGGTERKLADLKLIHFMDASQLSWSPDGKWLAFGDCDSDGDGCGICILAPETGEKRRLTKNKWARGDLDPAFSPDGRRLAFRRGENDSHTEIYILPLTEDGRTAGEPEMLTHRGVRSTSPVWSPDGRQIFFSSGIYYSGSDLYRVQVVPRTSQPPERLTTSTGDDYYSLAVSWRGGLLACTRKQTDVNIWAVEKGPAGWKKPEPVPLLSSTRTDQDPDFSPDGQQIAFVSNRSGNLEIWVSQRDGSQPRKLTSFNGAQIFSPRWSPEGRQITFSALWQDAFSIWLVEVVGGAPRKLAEPAGASSWSHDGRWIYYNSPGSARIFKIPAQGGTPVLLGDFSGGAPRESPDGRFLFFLSEGAIRKMPLVEGRRPEVEFVSDIHWPYVIRNDGIFFMGSPMQGMNSRRALCFRRFADKTTTEIATTGPRPSLGFAVSPDGNTLLYTQTDHDMTSLIFVRGF